MERKDSTTRIPVFVWRDRETLLRTVRIANYGRVQTKYCRMRIKPSTALTYLENLRGTTETNPSQNSTQLDASLQTRNRTYESR